CARSRESCRRSRPIRRAAASTRAARERPRFAWPSRRISPPCRRTVSAAATIMAEPLLALDDLAVHFKVGSALSGGVHTLKAVDGVTLHVDPRERLGPVGQSGS